MSWLTPRLEKFFVASVVLGLNGGALIILSFYQISPTNRDVIFQLVGGFSTLAGMVVGHYFRDGTKPLVPKEGE